MAAPTTVDDEGSIHQINDLNSSPRPHTSSNPAHDHAMHATVRTNASRIPSGLLQWAVSAVIATQSLFSPLDDFLIFVSEATNPASVLHYLVPVGDLIPLPPSPVVSDAGSASAGPHFVESSGRDTMPRCVRDRRHDKFDAKVACKGR